ncbi:MAG: DUF58 domain-containing protein [Williamsia sp.]|nr:DUF58 domain-containing protein [Williamsia sp.]
MAIKDLQLAAKTAVDGFLSGINRSTIKGPGLEFSQYRSYQPGEDLRWLDWKMYARSDRYYIRESEVETSISLRLVVDASGSMNHEDGGIKKIGYARYLAASLAYLAHKQGDAVGLYVCQEGNLFSLAARPEHQHMAHLYYQLEKIEAGGKFTDPVHYKNLFAAARRREIVIFISDLYERAGELQSFLDQLAAYKHEVIVFHLLARNEQELDFKGYTALQDLETGEVIKTDPGQIRKEYQQQLTGYLAALRMRMLDKGIFYRLISLDQPLDGALRDFLNQRTKLKT